MDERSTDAEILARAARRPELFSAIFDRHFAVIHRYLERRLGRDAADELSGEVFRIAFEQRGQFRAIHMTALPWLYGIATNLMLKSARQEARHLRAMSRLADRWDESDTDFAEADDRIAAQGARAYLLDALARLPQHDRDVLVLIAWEDFSYGEVADALGIPAGTVRSRLSRARRALRELLSEKGNELVTSPVRARSACDDG